LLARLCMPQSKNKRNRRPRRRRPRRRRRGKRSNRSPGNSALAAYVNMIKDPCDATLVPGMYGTQAGTMVKVKNSTTNALPTTSGYCLWVPTYHNSPFVAGGPELKENGFNLITYSSNNSGDRPPNTGLPGEIYPISSTPFDQPGATGAYTDPASGLIGQGNAIIRDARTVGACMKMTYFGRLDRTSGQVAVITGIPAESLITRTGQTNNTLSVDELFALTPHVERLGIDTREVVWRPDPQVPNTFMDSDDFCFRIPQNTPTVMGERAEDTQPTVIGFAWRGLSVEGLDQANLAFEFTKNIEWRPNPAKGLVNPAPVMIHERSYVKEALKYLDDNLPGWQSQVKSTVQSAGTRIAVAAATGYLSRFRSLH